VLAAVAEVGGEELSRLVDHRVGTAVLPDLEDVVAGVGLRWQADEPQQQTPELGVLTQDVEGGVSVTSVLRDGPAWRAGVTGGDRLVAIDGRVVGRGELDAVLRANAAGDEVEVSLTRGPRLLTLPVTLTEPTPRRRLVAAEEATDAQREAFRRWTGRPIDEL
jgi:predicted metalloprotease with PDZ domain